MPRPESLSAALRHVRDAMHLAAPGSSMSREQGWHLAGIGVECARKGVLGKSRFDKARGHDFPEHLASLAAALDPASRHLPPPVPELANWKIEHRYLPTGAPLPGDPLAASQAAARMVDAVVAALWADGDLERVPA